MRAKTYCAKRRSSEVLARARVELRLRDCVDVSLGLAPSHGVDRPQARATDTSRPAPPSSVTLVSFDSGPGFIISTNGSTPRRGEAMPGWAQ